MAESKVFFQARKSPHQQVKENFTIRGAHPRSFHSGQFGAQMAKRIVQRETLQHGFDMRSSLPPFRLTKPGVVDGECILDSQHFLEPLPRHEHEEVWVVLGRARGQQMFQKIRSGATKNPGADEMRVLFEIRIADIFLEIRIGGEKSEVVFLAPFIER